MRKKVLDLQNSQNFLTSYAVQTWMRRTVGKTFISFMLMCFRARLILFKHVIIYDSLIIIIIIIIIIIYTYNCLFWFRKSHVRNAPDLYQMVARGLSEAKPLWRREGVATKERLSEAKPLWMPEGGRESQLRNACQRRSLSGGREGGRER